MPAAMFTLYDCCSNYLLFRSVISVAMLVAVNTAANRFDTSTAILNVVSLELTNALTILQSATRSKSASTHNFLDVIVLNVVKSSGGRGLG